MSDTPNRRRAESLKARVGEALRDIAKIEKTAPSTAGHWVFVPDAPEEPE